MVGNGSTLIPSHTCSVEARNMTCAFTRSPASRVKCLPGRILFILGPYTVCQCHHHDAAAATSNQVASLCAAAAACSPYQTCSVSLLQPLLMHSRAATCCCTSTCMLSAIYQAGHGENHQLLLVPVTADLPKPKPHCLAPMQLVLLDMCLAIFVCQRQPAAELTSQHARKHMRVMPCRPGSCCTSAQHARIQGRARRTV